MKILVIEDNESVSSMIELFFSKEGIEGEFVKNGIEGYERARGRQMGLSYYRLDASRNGRRHDLPEIKTRSFFRTHYYANSEG